MASLSLFALIGVSFFFALNAQYSYNNCGDAEIVFVVDSSGSINDDHPSNWGRVQKFLGDITRQMTTFGTVRFGIVTFSNTANTVLRLDGYRDMKDLHSKINGLSYIGGTTNLAGGLQKARTEILTPSQVRPGAMKIIILMSDGKPNVRAHDTLPEAQRVKDANIRIIPIGVTDAIDLHLLQQVASKPNDVITTPDFISLTSQVANIVSLACGNVDTPGDCNKADIVFIVDSSDSIRQSDPADWDRVLSFLRNAIRGLSRISQDIRFGIVSFSYEARFVFGFNRYRTTDDVVNAVGSIQYIGSTTNIADGFRVARKQILVNARPDAAKLAILITDGIPNVEVGNTEPEVQRVKDLGFRVISIGVTRHVDEHQLRRIASNPTDAISSPSYAILAGQVDDIIGVACAKPQPSPPYVPAPEKPDGCGKADVMFLVDVSGSIKERNPADWDIALGFLRDTIRGLYATSNDIRFSIVVFSHEAYLAFDLRSRDLSDVLNEVAMLPYAGSTTDIAAGLQMVRTQVIPGARSDVAKILILVTDGKANEQVTLTEPEANAVKATGTRIISVGVTSFIDEPQLRRIASSPDGDVITTPSYSALGGKVRDIIEVACRQPVPIPSNPAPRPSYPVPAPAPAGCGKADVVFVVDSSGSIKATDPRDWDLVLDFLREAMRSMSNFDNDVRFAIVTFSYEARIVFGLNRYPYVNDAVNAVSTITYINSITNIAESLEITRIGVLNESRVGAAKIVILLTDGEPNKREYDTEPQATLLKRAGARIIPVGVTSRVNEAQLRRIASNRNDAVMTTDFKALEGKVGDIVKAACKPEPVPTPYDCKIADVIFLVDSSGSIKQANPINWDLVLNFLRDTMRGIARISPDVRFAIISFSYEARLVYDLDDYSNVNHAVRGVSRIPYIGSTTYIADAFKMAREKVLPTGRQLAAKTIILMTDAHPNVRVAETEPEAQKVKDLGVRVVSIGVTDLVDKAQLERIASTPRDSFNSPDFASLASRVSDLVGATCPQRD